MLASENNTVPKPLAASAAITRVGVVVTNILKRAKFEASTPPISAARRPMRSNNHKQGKSVIAAPIWLAACHIPI